MWIGKTLSKMEQLCVQSFLQNGHIFHLYTYNNIENIPKGILLKDGNDIIPFDKVFKDSSGGFSGFSNWFRYKLLHEKGGWWVDMDAICVKFFDIKEEYCFSSERDFSQDVVVNCGFIKTPPKADFLTEVLDYINSADHANVKWGQFGPKLFNAIIQTYDSEKYIKPPETFCPINWYEISALLHDHKMIFGEQTFAIHLWNEIWRKENFDKNANYHPDSIYEQLKKRYRIL